MVSSMNRTWSLFVAVLLAGCSSSAVQAPLGGGRSAVGERIPADFAERESAIYHDLDPLVLRCTLRQNAQAGRVWLEQVSGKHLEGASGEEILRLADEALARHRELTAGELADAGWLVAELVRAAQPSAYSWLEEQRQVALKLEHAAAAPPLLPMQLAEDAWRGRKSLARLVGAVKGASGLLAEDPDCRGVNPADVLRHRFSWQ